MVFYSVRPQACLSFFVYPKIFKTLVYCLSSHRCAKRSRFDFPSFDIGLALLFNHSCLISWQGNVTPKSEWCIKITGPVWSRSWLIMQKLDALKAVWGNLSYKNSMGQVPLSKVGGSGWVFGGNSFLYNNFDSQCSLPPTSTHPKHTVCVPGLYKHLGKGYNTLARKYNINLDSRHRIHTNQIICFYERYIVKNRGQWVYQYKSFNVLSQISTYIVLQYLKTIAVVFWFSAITGGKNMVHVRPAKNIY